jgi:Glyoxalase/Bleomycin resistance protein/Dioxygenase superfamily
VRARFERPDPKLRWILVPGILAALTGELFAVHGRGFPALNDVHRMDASLDPMVARMAWYRDMLGFRIIRAPTRAWPSAVLERRGFLLELGDAAARRDEDNRPAILVQIEDVDQLVSKLEAAGGVVEHGPEDEVGGKYRSAFVRDASGVLVKLREVVRER